MNAPVRKKVWFVAGAAWGAIQGTAMIITRALYGLKASAEAWRIFFSKSLKEMGYTLCVADPYVYMKKKVNKEGYKYWSYVLVYIDDCLLVYHDPNPIMEDLKL